MRSGPLVVLPSWLYAFLLRRRGRHSGVERVTTTRVCTHAITVCGLRRQPGIRVARDVGTDGRDLNEVRTGRARTAFDLEADRKSTRLNSSHIPLSRMPSSA